MQQRCRYQGLMAQCYQSVWQAEELAERDKYCYYHTKINKGITTPVEGDPFAEDEDG